MEKYFKNLPLTVVTDIESLERIIADKPGKAHLTRVMKNSRNDKVAPE
jgi:hypothetical protein